MELNLNKVHTSRNAIDKVILLLIFLLAALPFGQVFYLKLGFITFNLFELIYLGIVFLIVIKILTFGKIRKALNPFLSFFIIVVIYFLISVVFYKVSIDEFLRQFRLNYFQFFIATMLLLVNIDIETENYLYLLCIAGALGSALDLTMYYFMPNVLAKMLSSSEDLLRLTFSSGYLYWPNSTIIFFIVLFILLPEKKIRIKKPILSLILLFCLWALFYTFNRTMMIGLIIFLFGYAFLKKDKIFKKDYSNVFVLILILLVVICIAFSSPVIRSLVIRRYFGSGYGFRQIYELSIVNQRYSLYNQYLESLRSYFPIGQGLGRPFSIGWDGVNIFVTDISFVQFLLPFGVFGIFIFYSFLRTLFKLTLMQKKFINPSKINLIVLLLGVMLVVSLNFDVYVRNNFVIFATVLVLTLQNSRKVNGSNE